MIFTVPLQTGTSLSNVAYLWIIDGTQGPQLTTGITQPDPDFAIFRIECDPPENAEEIIVYDVTDESNWNPGQFLLSKLRIGGDSAVIPVIPSDSWEVLTAEDVLSEFTVAEASSIRSLQGSGSGSGLPFGNIDSIVIRVIDEVRGYVVSGGYSVDDDPRTIPISLFEDAIAIARWRLLIATPSFKQLQTDERKEAFELALKKLLLIAQQQFAVESPIPDVNPRSGNWNSENKLIMRTHPIPTPATQFQPPTDAYANPDGPPDRAPS